MIVVGEPGAMVVLHANFNRCTLASNFFLGCVNGRRSLCFWLNCVCSLELHVRADGNVMASRRGGDHTNICACALSVCECVAFRQAA